MLPVIYPGWFGKCLSLNDSNWHAAKMRTPREELALVKCSKEGEVLHLFQEKRQRDFFFERVTSVIFISVAGNHTLILRSRGREVGWDVVALIMFTTSPFPFPRN